MRVFVRVVEQGSFARAADHFHLARPSVTLAVAKLEKRLGTRLLHRTTRRLSLTDEGRTFYQGCVRILDDIAETEDALSGARGSPRGRLRASVPNAFIHQQFFSELPRFRARYPDLQLELVITDRAVNLVEEGIDCAVRAVTIPDDSTLVAREISSISVLTCASPGYLKARGTPRTIEDLDHHECIRFISPSTGRAADWRFRRGEEDRSYTPRGAVGVTSLEGAASAARAGIGIAQISDVIIVPALRTGELLPVLLDWAAQGPILRVVYPSSRYLTAKVRVFSDYVAEIYPRAGVWPDIAAMAGRG